MVRQVSKFVPSVFYELFVFRMFIGCKDAPNPHASEHCFVVVQSSSAWLAVMMAAFVRMPCIVVMANVMLLSVLFDTA
jgi:hypothetical protein